MTEANKHFSLKFLTLAASMLLAGSMAYAEADSVGNATTNSANNSALANPFGKVVNANATLATPSAAVNGSTYAPRLMLTPQAYEKKKLLKQANKNTTATLADTSKLLSYGGDSVVSGSPKVYLVVYGSQWGTAYTNSSGNMVLSNDPVGAVPYLQNMFRDLGTGGERWSGTMTQYCDGPAVAKGSTSCPDAAPHVGYPASGLFAGIWYDNSAPSPSNATSADLDQEALRAAAHFGNTTSVANRYAQYIILSPANSHPGGFNTPAIKGTAQDFCAYHSAALKVSFPLSNIFLAAYTNMPYVTDYNYNCYQDTVNTGAQGYLDAFSVVLGHEYAETLTDQYGKGGWIRPSDGFENGDICAGQHPDSTATYANIVTARGTYAMQSTWSNDTNRCEISHLIWNKYNSLVEQLYLAYTNRPAEPAGLTFWANQLAAANAPSTAQGLVSAYSSNAAVKAIIDGFGNSIESRNVYPGDNSAYVTAIYVNEFNRVPDSAGLMFWLTALNNGTPKNLVPMGILVGAQNLDAITVAKKTAISINFTAAIDSPAEIAAYGGIIAGLKVRQMLGMVDSNTDINAFQPTINTTVASIVVNH